MSKNVLLKLSFDGTDFHGFQVQKNAVTIQETLQNGLEELLQYRPPVTGCSRTDSGVHAREYYCIFPLEKEFSLHKLPAALNVYLPDSISTCGAAYADEGFHPRYSAIWKEYTYHIWNSRVRNPFLDRYSAFCPYKLDIPSMQRAAGAFIGKKDFKGFMASGSTVKDTVREIFRCDLNQNGYEIILTIRADGFLYNMVRIIAGTLMDIGAGKLKEADIAEIIKSCDRSKAGKTAPAKGLFLNTVYYGKDIDFA
ncbi:MAG: tRNA pseudouridine(38-40) synthase TruA [Bacillota bacterium]|nr:tRNA pseudouridine(38-40) synthase TruA [Bacillota bacterium]